MNPSNTKETEFTAHDSGAKFEIFVAATEAGRLNKLCYSEMKGVFLAVEQMLSKGKVSAQELRIHWVK